MTKKLIEFFHGPLDGEKRKLGDDQRELRIPIPIAPAVSVYSEATEPPVVVETRTLVHLYERCTIKRGGVPAGHAMKYLGTRWL